jgi:hypothetical protein
MKAGGSSRLKPQFQRLVRKAHMYGGIVVLMLVILGIALIIHFVSDPATTAPKFVQLLITVTQLGKYL